VSGEKGRGEWGTQGGSEGRREGGVAHREYLLFGHGGFGENTLDKKDVCLAHD